jgi:type IV pilus assembly protein PilX
MKKPDRFKQRRSSPPTQQKGIVLIIVIVAIVAMMVAVFSMLRLTSSSMGVAGNLAFKKNATSAADLGVEQAISYVLTTHAANPALLYTDQASAGYFATWIDTPGNQFDPFTYNWSSTTAAQATTDDGSGNSVMYVIHRLCANTGAVTSLSQSCVRPSPLYNQGGSGTGRTGATTPGTGGTLGGGGGGGGGPVVATLPEAYYRITTRVAGPRNTLSYTQVIIY